VEFTPLKSPALHPAERYYTLAQAAGPRPNAILAVALEQAAIMADFERQHPKLWNKCLGAR